MTNKPKRKSKNRFAGKKKIVYIIAVLLGLAFSSLFLLIFWLGLQFANTTSYYYGNEAVTQIAEYIENPLPNSVYDVSFEIQHFDADIRIQFKLPPEDAELWLMNSNLCFDHRQPSPETNSQFDIPDGWHLENNGGRLRTHCYVGVRYYGIIVDISEVTHWTFHLTMIDH